MLQNGDGRWTSSHNWTLPSINETGVIRNADTGMVLGIVDTDSGEYKLFFYAVVLYHALSTRRWLFH